MPAIPLRYNLRNLWVRKVPTALTVFCISLVIAVFLVVMALGFGLVETLRAAGRADNWIVMRQSADAEMQSIVRRDAALEVIQEMPGISRAEDGTLLFSAEVVVLRNLARRDGVKANVPIRGVGPAGFLLRPEIEIVSGRTFRPSLGEVLVSRRFAQRFPGKDLGASFEMARRTWTVVGHFDARGTAYDSEIWADVNDVREAFERDEFSSVTFRAASPGAGAEIARRIADDKRLRSEAKTERAYYEAQTQSAGPILGLGMTLAVVMAIGAAAAGMITMYAAVASRAAEIGTLRALGFGRGAVLLSFLFESVLIASLGGALGSLLALPWNGVTSQTTNWTTFSEVGFAFRVTPGLVGAGLAFSVLIGLAGGFVPARAAMRLPIASAVRGA